MPLYYKTSKKCFSKHLLRKNKSTPNLSIVLIREIKSTRKYSQRAFTKLNPHENLSTKDMNVIAK